MVLDQLEYLDSTGIGELLASRERAERAGQRFVVTPGTGPVRHILWVAGVLGHLCSTPAS